MKKINQSICPISYVNINIYIIALFTKANHVRINYSFERGRTAKRGFKKILEVIALPCLPNFEDKELRLFFFSLYIYSSSCVMHTRASLLQKKKRKKKK